MISTIARRRRSGTWAAGTVALLLGLGLMQAAPAAPAEADSVNLLSNSNPGFEMDPGASSGTSTILYWQRSPTGAQGTSVSVAATQSYSGDQSVLIVDGNDRDAVGLLSHYVPVNLDASYTAGARVKVLTGKAIVYLKFYDSSGIEVGQVAKTVTGSANQWAPVRLNGTPPPNTDHARVLLYSSTQNMGVSYADDVTLTEHPNLLTDKNPGFEDTNGTSTILYWKRFPSEPLPPTTSSVSVTDEEVHTGSNSVLISDVDSTQVGLSQAVIVQPYASYTAGAYVRVVTGAAIVSLKFYNSANAEIGNSVQTVSGPINQWKQVWVESTAPETATYARVLITSGSTVGQSYVDDVSFAEADPVFSSHDAPVDLGEATFTTKTLGGVIGNGEVYFVTNGAPGTFYALDATTGAINFSEQVVGTTETWALTVGSDGNVYFAGTASTKFWRYDPQAKEVTLLGDNPTGDKYVWDLDASSDGMIYGATSSPGDGKMFSYDTNSTATNKFTDLGVIYPGEDYVHSVGVTDQYVYAGIGTSKHLIRIDRGTGDKVPVPLPVDVEGQAGSINAISIYDGRLYVANGTGLLVMDEDTFDVEYHTLVTDVNTFDGLISPPSPYDSDLLYFRNKNTSTLWTYDAGTSEIHAVTPTVDLPTINAKAMNWVTANGHQVLGMLFENGQYWTYDPQSPTGEADDHSVELSESGVTLNSLAAGPDDGKLYLGGYIDGMSVFDEGAKSYEIHHSPTSPHQIEHTGFLDGKAYFGAYPGARIYRYDAAEPYGYGSNPELVYTLPHEQYQGRPFAFESGDDKLFIGTVPAYDYQGGSLTIYDDTTGIWTSTRNVVQDQSIVSLAYKDGTLFGGTSISGGLGGDNSTTTAKMFTWDVATSTGTDEFVPQIPGMPSPELIGDLTFGPDGLLWGAAYGELREDETGFAIYAMDADTHEIVKSSLMYYGKARGNYWREYYLLWGADGMLYTSIGRFVTVVDPNTLAYRKLVDTTAQTHVMALGDDGSIYYGKGSHLLQLPRTGN